MTWGLDLQPNPATSGPNSSSATVGSLPNHFPTDRATSSDPVLHLFPSGLLCHAAIGSPCGPNLLILCLQLGASGKMFGHSLSTTTREWNSGA